MGVTVGGAQRGVQLRDQLPHTHLVHVLGDKVEKEEVSELLDRVQVGVGQDVHNLVPPDSACSGLKQD